MGGRLLLNNAECNIVNAVDSHEVVARGPWLSSQCYGDWGQLRWSIALVEWWMLNKYPLEKTTER